MTTDVKLLPLPELNLRYGHFGEDALAYATDYARANMEPLIAENERLAEALRLALKWAEVLPTGEPLRAESVRDLDEARAALDQARGKGGGE